MKNFNEFFSWMRGIAEKLEIIENTLLGVGEDLYKKEEILRVDQVAEVFNKTDLTIKEWARDGTLPAYKHPKTRDMIFFKNEIIAHWKKYPIVSRDRLDNEADDFLDNNPLV
jgi:hypothetical protein